MDKNTTKVVVNNNINVDYHKCFQACAACMAVVDLDGHFVQINDAWTEFLGYENDVFLNLTFQEITHPNDLQLDLSRLNDLRAGLIDSYRLEKRYRHIRGYYVWGKLTVSIARNDAGEPDYYIAVVENISAQKQSESLLYQSEEKFRTIVNALSEQVMIWMATPGIERILYVSSAFEDLWGVPIKQWYRKPKSFLERIHDEDKSHVLMAIERHKEGEWDVEYRLVLENGEVHYIHDVGHPIYNEEGELQHIVCTCFDRTRDKLKEQEIAKAYSRLIQTNERLNEMASTDFLTGVFNRRAMENTLNDEIKLYQRKFSPAVLTMFDLDKFKQVNDQHGHSAGDRVLVAFAHALYDLIRETDEIGRFGGDEFIVLLRNSDISEAQQFIDRVIAKNIQAVLDDDTKIPVEFSAGLVELNPEIQSAKDWLMAADVQMYEDKEES